MNASQVSIIIPVHNRYDYLSLQLHSHLLFTPQEAEIVVVNHPEKKSWASKINYGVSLARGEILIFLNDDLVVSPNWLDQFLYDLEFLKNKGIKVGLLGARSWGLSGIQGHPEYLSRNEYFVSPRIIDGISLIERRAFEEVGGHDESGEGNQFRDDDLSLRLWFKGYRNVMGLVYLHHFGGGTLGEKAREDFQVSRQWFEKKWGKSPEEIYQEIARSD